MKVRLSTTGEDIRIVLNSMETIGMAKKKLQDQEGLQDPSTQRWYFGGKLLGRCWLVLCLGWRTDLTCVVQVTGWEWRRRMFPRVLSFSALSTLWNSTWSLSSNEPLGQLDCYHDQIDCQTLLIRTETQTILWSHCISSTSLYSSNVLYIFTYLHLVDVVRKIVSFSYAVIIKPISFIIDNNIIFNIKYLIGKNETETSRISQWWLSQVLDQIKAKPGFITNNVTNVFSCNKFDLKL